MIPVSMCLSLKSSFRFNDTGDLVHDVVSVVDLVSNSSLTLRHIQAEDDIINQD